MTRYFCERCSAQQDSEQPPAGWQRSTMCDGWTCFDCLEFIRQAFARDDEYDDL